MNTKQPKAVIRYSPKPMSEYKLWRPNTPTEYKKGSGNLDSHTIQFTLKAHEPATWNLAYLSHPFERGNPPKDLMLYVWCSHFVRTNIHTGEVNKNHSDVLEIPDDHVYPQLLKPAPQFIKWLDDNQDLLLRSNIYATYGDRWLNQIRKRALICATYDEPEEEPQIRSLQDAQAVLQRLELITSKHHLKKNTDNVTPTKLILPKKVEVIKSVEPNLAENSQNSAVLTVLRSSVKSAAETLGLTYHQVLAKLLEQD